MKNVGRGVVMRLHGRCEFGFGGRGEVQGKLKLAALVSKGGSGSAGGVD